MDCTRMARHLPWLVMMLAFLTALPAAGQNKNVTVDDQPTAEQRLGRVKELHQAGRNDQAVELMQELIENSRFKLVGLGDGSYSDAERWCRKTLLTNVTLRDAYRTRYAATATHALDQALASEQPIERLLEVYRLYTVTPSGFDAGLNLIGLLLESGEATSAASLIEELRRHPDRKAHEQQLIMLRGAAAAYTNDADLLTFCVEQLKEQGDTDRAVWLSALGDSVVTEARVIRPALTDMGEKPDTLSKILWQQPIASVHGADAWAMRDVFMLPEVTESLALINNGRQVLAYDRASGQRAWTYPRDNEDEVTRTKFGQRWYDARSVGTGGGVVCAVLGECYGITETRNPYVLPNKLACIDPQTGRARWERVSGVIGENEPLLDQDRRVGRVNLQHTHFVGTPVVTRGRVLALLRRTSTQRIQSTWLMCYDTDSGALLWYRHISLLSLNSSRESNKNTPQIAVEGETAYVSDGIATVAAVDVYSGGYRWLRVLPVGYGSTQKLTVKARGVLSPPVMTRAGLLVSVSLHREPLMLLDPEDGSVLQDFDEHPVLSDARYMLEADGGAIIVAYDSISFWDAREAEVAWTFNLEPDEYTLGQGDVSKRYVVVPTVRRVLVLDCKTGKLIQQNPVAEVDGGTTNLVVRDGELFTVNEDDLSLYATWDSVFGRLVERVKDSPGDPSGGIALASLALKQEGMTDAVLQGVGYALKAIEHQPMERMPLIRRRIFDQLRELTPLAKQSELRSQLLDRMALVSETASQEVAYHLDAGSFLASQGQAERAVEHFHAVLSEPAFVSEQYIAPDGIERPAGDFAKTQIEILIQRYGRGVYARQDAIARAWLDQAKTRGTLDSAALINIARRFPLSLGTVEVLLDAAQQSQRDGKMLDALSLYQQAVVRSSDSKIRARAIGMLLSFYLSTQAQDAAIELINRETQFDEPAHPIDPKTNQPSSLDAWRLRIEQSRPPAESSPNLGDKLGMPVVVPGRLVPRHPEASKPMGDPRLYLQHEDGTLSSHQLAKPKLPVWSVMLPAGSGQLSLLIEQPEQALFWSASNARLLAINPANGEQQWSVQVSLNDEPRFGGGLIQAQQGQLNPEAYLVAVSGAVICVGHRDRSELVALDRATGSQLWRTSLGINRLSVLKVDDWRVYAAGPAGHAHQVRSGRLIAIDLFTGERFYPENSEAIALTPRDIHLVGSQIILTGVSGVARIDPISGRTIWLRRIRGATLSEKSALVGRTIVVAGSNGIGYSLDIDNNGQITQQQLMRRSSDPDDVDVHADDNLAVLRGGLGLIGVGQDAAIAWRRPDSGPGYVAHLLMGSPNLASINRHFEPGDTKLTWSVELIERNTGRVISRYVLDGLDESSSFENAERIGSVLAIPAAKTTAIIACVP